MEQGYTWWVNFGKNIRAAVSLSWWSPIDKFEIRRSLKIERFHNNEIPFISVVFAVWFVKFEWYLYWLS